MTTLIMTYTRDGGKSWRSQAFTRLQGTCVNVAACTILAGAGPNAQKSFQDAVYLPV